MGTSGRARTCSNRPTLTVSRSLKLCEISPLIFEQAAKVGSTADQMTGVYGWVSIRRVDAAYTAHIWTHLAAQNFRKVAEIDHDSSL